MNGQQFWLEAFESSSEGHLQSPVKFFTKGVSCKNFQKKKKKPDPEVTFHSSSKCFSYLLTLKNQISKCKKWRI